MVFFGFFLCVLWPTFLAVAIAVKGNFLLLCVMQTAFTFRFGLFSSNNNNSSKALIALIECVFCSIFVFSVKRQFRIYYFLLFCWLALQVCCLSLLFCPCLWLLNVLLVYTVLTSPSIPCPLVVKCWCWCWLCNKPNMARKLFKNEKLGREIDFWGVKKSTHMGDIYIYLFICYSILISLLFSG